MQIIEDNMGRIINWIACQFIGHLFVDLTKMQIWNMNNGRKIPTQHCWRCSQVRSPEEQEGQLGFEWGKWHWED